MCGVIFEFFGDWVVFIWVSEVFFNEDYCVIGLCGVNGKSYCVDYVVFVVGVDIGVIIGIL